MKKLVLLFACLLVMVPCLAQNPKVILETNFGNIIIELYANDAPVTVDNFLHYIADDFYDGLIFHRVIPGFMIQGGWKDVNMVPRTPRDPIINEFSFDHSNIRGTIAMAKVGGDPNSATSQFFINLADNSSNLDNQNGGFTVFGHVVDGMDVVDTIAALPTTSDVPNVPPGPAVMLSVRILGDFEKNNKTDVSDYSFLAGQWGDSSLPQELTPSDGAAADWFGYSVDIDGDYAIVGAVYSDPNGSKSGSAYIFNRNGSIWTQQAKLTASDATAGDDFGYSVSISSDHVLIGAPGDDDGGSKSGSAYIFKRFGISWTQQAKLHASDSAVGDWFGGAVAIDANNIIIGALGNDDAGDYAGSAYIFEKPIGQWTDANETIKIAAPSLQARSKFGIRVDISGNYAIVGAIEDNDVNSGSVHIFRDDGANWIYQQSLTPNNSIAGMWFGYSVAIDSDGFALAGAINDDTNGLSSGSVTSFTEDVNGWTESDTLFGRDTAYGDNFGYSVAIDDNYRVAGAKYDDDNANNSGSVYIFVGHIPIRKVVISGGAANDYFGHSVAASGGYAIAGAYQDNGIDSGAAYIFKMECPQADLNGDCLVNAFDLSLFIDNWLISWTP